MLDTLKPVAEVTGIDPRAIPDTLLRSTQPVVIRGLVSHWPVVQAASQSARATSDYMKRFYRDATVGAWLGTPDIDGRFFYNDDFNGFNFRPELLKLNTVLDELERHLDTQKPPAIYVGSTTVDSCLPGFSSENNVDLGTRQPLMSLWIGNRTRVSAHFDLPDNLACVAAGRRRFTVFPPAELANLYVGPIDLTPAGQAISLVDFANPDWVKFPRFADALKNAQVVDLEAGDAIFIPSMWWHHVESLSNFNVLINYWWRQSPDYMDSPMNTLMLALLSIRDLPKEQRNAWANIFDHYVFKANDETSSHIPEHARRMLGPIDADAARMLRALLLKKLNR